MNKTNRRWLVLAVGAVFVAGCGSAAATPSAGAAVRIQVELPRVQVVAGQTVSGDAVVTNTTDAPITVTACPADWLRIGIANARVTFDPPHSAVLCHPSITLAPGPNRFPITVETTYLLCTGPDGTPTAQAPACVAGDQPPLPAGSYLTKVVTTGLSNVDTGTPVTVTVLTAP